MQLCLFPPKKSTWMRALAKPAFAKFIVEVMKIHCKCGVNDGRNGKRPTEWQCGSWTMFRGICMIIYDGGLNLDGNVSLDLVAAEKKYQV